MWVTVTRKTDKLVKQTVQITQLDQDWSSIVFVAS